jgi:D-serine dehydratase
MSHKLHGQDRAEKVGEPVFELASAPFLVLRESALQNNLGEMQRFCEENGASLAPHCKTHMSAELWERQLEHGAVGATVATVAQAEALAEHGARRILIANEVVDDAGLRAVARLRLGDQNGSVTEVSMLVDSVEGVRSADRVFGSVGIPSRMPVLVELGAPGRRCGCRSVEEVLAVAEAVAASSTLQLVGLEGYEGVFGTGTTAERTAAVEDYLATAVECIRRLRSAGLISTPSIASFGGSRYYPTVVEAMSAAFGAGEIDVILRSGCYLLHDHGTYALSHAEVPSTVGKPALEPAIEVWGAVLSTPEPGSIIVGIGKRDVSADEGLPVVLSRHRDAETTALGGLTVSRLNDQHAYLVPSGSGQPDVRVGDLIAFGISHPCTTMDKWRSAFVVDDDHVVQGEIATLFH